MAILNGKYKVKNSQNSYDIVHLETSASQVKFDDGKTFQEKIDETIANVEGYLSAYETIENNNKKLSEKVDKVDGKGLSTNDFTGEYKTKLEGLSNYIHPDSEDIRHVTDEEKSFWNNKSEAHNHPYKPDTYVPVWDEITDKPSVFTPSYHNHNEIYYDKDTVNTLVEPIDELYINGLFTSLGDDSSPIDYYTKSESDEKYATKEEVNENKTSILELQTEVNGQRLRGINIANAIIDKLER